MFQGRLDSLDLNCDRSTNVLLRLTPPLQGFLFCENGAIFVGLKNKVENFIKNENFTPMKNFQLLSRFKNQPYLAVPCREGENVCEQIGLTIL